MKKHLKQLHAVNRNDSKKILFLGSYYPPNFDAVFYIIKHLGPSLREHQFIIAGSVVQHFLEPFSKLVSCHIESDLPIRLFEPPPGKYATYGFHQLEEWPGKVHVRWTKRRWGAIPGSDDFDGFYFRACSPKRLGGIVRVDGAERLKFRTQSSWNTFYADFNGISDSKGVEIDLERSWKALGDSRSLGIAISEMGFLKKGIKFKIPLQNISCQINFDNFVLISNFDEEEKLTLLNSSDIAINPIFNGSGSNVKMFEYMAAGLPIVTTPVGARGILGIHMEDFIIADPPKFKNYIDRLCKDPDLYQKLSEKARKRAENHYDWEATCEPFRRLVKECINISMSESKEVISDKGYEYALR